MDLYWNIWFHKWEELKVFKSWLPLHEMENIYPRIHYNSLKDFGRVTAPQKQQLEEGLKAPTPWAVYWEAGTM